MRKRLSVLSVLAIAVGALAGLPAGASARHGADDPAGHVRHGRGADDGIARTARRSRRRGADDPAGHVRRGRGADDGVVLARAARRGADDPAGHVRQGRGADDAPNHG